MPTPPTHPAGRRPRKRRRRLLSETRLRTEIERLQRRVEYHQQHPGPASAAIVATYEQMLLLRRQLLAGDDHPDVQDETRSGA